MNAAIIEDIMATSLESPVLLESFELFLVLLVSSIWVLVLFLVVWYSAWKASMIIVSKCAQSSSLPMTFTRIRSQVVQSSESDLYFSSYCDPSTRIGTKLHSSDRELSLLLLLLMMQKSIISEFLSRAMNSVPLKRSGCETRVTADHWDMYIRLDILQLREDVVDINLLVTGNVIT